MEILFICAGLFSIGYLFYQMDLDGAFTLSETDVIVNFVKQMKQADRINYKIKKSDVSSLKEIIKRELPNYSYSSFNIKRAVNYAINRYISNIGIVNHNEDIDINKIDEMSGIEFEHFLKEFFERKGFKASITKGSGDQGVDLILTKDNRKIAVQAKRYKSKIGNSAIQEVAAGKLFYDCNEAYVITSSFFTKAAVSLAVKINVEILDRNDLIRLFNNEKNAI